MADDGVAVVGFAGAIGGELLSAASGHRGVVLHFVGGGLGRWDWTRRDVSDGFD